jgi:Uncharacterized protein conserved in bacteria
MQRNSQVEQLLLAIEEELRLQALWQAKAPSPEALESTLPFCVDTLEFHQWVQFVLLARLRQMIDLSIPLPTQSALHAMATEVYKEETVLRARLIALLAELDGALTGQGIR